jgi:hypothetical protein
LVVEGLFEVAAHSLNLSPVPACEETVHFGEEDAKAVPELRLLLGNCGLLPPQVYVLGEFEEKYREANN